MLKRNTALTVAFATALTVPLHAYAVEERDLAEIRNQIQQLKNNYEARIQSLEKQLQEATAKQKTSSSPLATNEAPSPAVIDNQASVATGSNNSFNPAISLVLAGTYANLSQDPSRYRLQGFMTDGEIGPGKRSFNLGESELTFSANIDHIFSGQLTFALDSDNSASVEEAFIRAKGLADGVNVTAGRFLSSVGYLNNQHSHVWDFVDAPLAYQAFLGGQYKQDGLQFKWLAPTSQFIEFGAEIGNGSSFPGTDRNKNGINSVALFARTGGDIDASSSWRAGLSYLRTRADNREHSELDGNEYTFNGRSHTWIIDGVYKWAPGGNASYTNFKLQGEYFRRNENGTLAQDDDSGSYRSRQSGWYVQGIYQFMPKWRTGVRYDKLYSGTPNIGIDHELFPSLASYSPSRISLMLDYSPSEFSRLRLQLAQDKSRPGATDNQVFLQYIMSLGAHGAHSF